MSGCNSFIILFFVLQCSTKQALHFQTQRVNTVTSPYEFIRLWQAIKVDTDLSEHAQVLQAVPPSHLSSGNVFFYSEPIDILIFISWTMI